MKKPAILCWTVTVQRPGRANPVTVQPIAKNKLQAAKRAAVMLDLNWRDNVRYIRVSGPYKTLARQRREWNEAYPEWSTEREEST